MSQGFPKDCRLHLPTSLCVFASGNAYPVPCIIACVHGMVAALATFDLLNWPPHDMAGVKVPANGWCVKVPAAAVAAAVD